MLSDQDWHNWIIQEVELVDNIENFANIVVHKIQEQIRQARHEAYNEGYIDGRNRS